jgi:hypothetical protein
MARIQGTRLHRSLFVRCWPGGLPVWLELGRQHLPVSFLNLYCSSLVGSSQEVQVDGSWHIGTSHPWTRRLPRSLRIRLYQGKRPALSLVSVQELPLVLVIANARLCGGYGLLRRLSPEC